MVVRRTVHRTFNRIVRRHVALVWTRLKAVKSSRSNRSRTIHALLYAGVGIKINTRRVEDKLLTFNVDVCKSNHKFEATLACCNVVKNHDVGVFFFLIGFSVTLGPCQKDCIL